MRRIRPDEWEPVGGIRLEPNAETVVKSDCNYIAVAGPGAGKTELLAQRACYLLETGLCPEPRMILAISFKRDAARNLSNRVEMRCGKELARRFHSMTYDAFAKSLVDRFRVALPDRYRPSSDYRVITNPKKEYFEEWVGRLDISMWEYRQLNTEAIMKDLCKHKLPLKEECCPSLCDTVIAKLWLYLLTATERSAVTFPMISRLAELLLRENPLLLSALRACYSHVFLDEFQDTTVVQYDLLLTAFRGSKSILTAVGDHRQRIMGWAGALPQVIDDFVEDFGASRIELTCNYRSAPRLVQMQHVLARYLDPESSLPSWSKEYHQDTDGVCKVILFDDYMAEAEAVSRIISELITEEGLRPRDIAILAKQKVEVYCGQIIKALSEFGIKARIESEMQDLLSEPCINVLMSVLRLAAGERNPKVWQEILDLLAALRNTYVSEIEDTIVIERQFQSFLYGLREELARLESSCSTEDLETLFQRVFGFIGLEPFKAYYAQYNQGSHFDENIRKAAECLLTYLVDCHSFESAVMAFYGEDAVPIMTIHKSKGLEYDTVFFVGLEDRAFWNYCRQQQEDTCAFFVAFSRAKRRVYFTFSVVRNSGRRGGPKVETRHDIRTLYELLEQAGAEVVDLRTRGTSL